MIPQLLFGLFVAATGAAAALLGLLFVAVSIRPERITAATSAESAIAANTLLALVDAFFVSFGALLPATTCAWVALIIGLVALVGNILLAYTLLYRELNPRLVRHRSMLVGAAFLIFVLQYWFAVRLLLDPREPAPAYGLVHVLLGVFALGIVRAYGLTGVRPAGFAAWLGPRQYTELPEPKTSTSGDTRPRG